MYCVKKVRDELFWVGVNDRRINLFENVFPVANGVSYNAYLLLDEKTVLFDTVDRAVSDQFFDNLYHVLDGRTLDYVVVNHMEPDHCATLGAVIRRFPDVKIVCNKMILGMIKQFFDLDLSESAVIVKEKDTLCTGTHTLTFLMAPMVHWPEVMVTYDMTTKTLFSADAFGTFGALNGNIFADELPFAEKWLDDARRYYTNIVGKYGPQVQALLKKASTVEIEMICPLHGPVWRKNIEWFVEKYQTWSSYTPEEDAVMIAYGSVYGNTENTAQILANKLGDAGVKNIVMYDVSVTHPSVIVSEAFRCSHLVFASTTYNAGIFCNMETVLHDIVAHNLQNRTVALIENGSWAPTSGGLMEKMLSSLKNMTFIGKPLTIRSALKEEQMEMIDEMANGILETMAKPEEIAPVITGNVDNNAMFKLSYGLFVLSAKDGDKDNGCIVNTVEQLTTTPNRISVAINKDNLTHDMVLKTGVFNASVLDEEAKFSTFERYGYVTGRDTDKFAGVEGLKRSENGLIYLEEGVNSFISGKVVSTVDCGTHTLFIADVTEAAVLGKAPSLTYARYFSHVKPKPQPVEENKKGFVCKICNYVYEGDTLPADFICPLCKHGAADFEELK